MVIIQTCATIVPPAPLFSHLPYMISNYKFNIFIRLNKKNICFWLDAHYPESDVLNVPFDSCQDEDIRLPLWEELNLIKNLRPNNKDVILMDDVMLFTENEIFPDNHLKIAFPIKPKKHINYLDKITSLFSETHDNKIVKKDSGYLSITPKNEKI